MNEALQKIEDNKSFLQDLRRLLKAWFRREYRVVPWWSLFLFAYIISPIDFLPEAFLAFIGIADDAAALALLIRSLMTDVERFREWERRRVQTTDSRFPQVNRLEKS